MNPSNIMRADLGGGRFAYRARQVLAESRAAANEASELGQGRGFLANVEQPEGLDDVFVVTFDGPIDQGDEIDQVVREAILGIDGVQPNHVFFAHGTELPQAPDGSLLAGDTDDPCCGQDPLQIDVGAAVGETRLNPFWANPFWANPFWANPFWANPFWANPFWANPSPSSAIPMPQPEGLPPMAAANDKKVVILDSGLGDFVGAAPPVTWADVQNRPEDEPGRSAMPLKVNDYRNEWLKPRPNVSGDHWDRADLFPSPFGDGFVDPVAGHGTFIAGIYEQLVPGCEVVVRSVLGQIGEISELTILKAIQRVIVETPPEKYADSVINMSFGGPLHDPVQRPLSTSGRLAATIAQASELGIVLVASAGNEGICEPTYPAAFERVVGVAALGPGINGAPPGPAYFSNRGEWVSASAIGVDILSTFIKFDGAAQPQFLTSDSAPLGVEVQDPDDFNEGWALWSGTSFAAPIAAAALIAHALATGTAVNQAESALIDGGTRLPCVGVPIGVPPPSG